MNEGSYGPKREHNKHLQVITVSVLHLPRVETACLLRSVPLHCTYTRLPTQWFTA